MGHIGCMRGGGKIKVSDISVLGLPPYGCHLGRPTVGAVAAVWGTSATVDEGHQGGKIKVSDIIGTRFAPLWLPFGPLWVQWRPFGANRVHERGGKIKVSDISVLSY